MKPVATSEKPLAKPSAPQMLRVTTGGDEALNAGLDVGFVFAVGHAEPSVIVGQNGDLGLVLGDEGIDHSRDVELAFGFAAFFIEKLDKQAA